MYCGNLSCFKKVLLTPGSVGNRAETPLTDSVVPPLAAYPGVPKRQEVYSTLEFRLRPHTAPIRKQPHWLHAHSDNTNDSCKTSNPVSTETDLN